MLQLISKLAPVITGLTKHEDGTDKPVSGEFNWLVRLPLLLGTLLVLLSLFAPSLTADRRDALFNAGLGLLLAGPAVYHGKKQLGQKDAPAPTPVAAPPEPPAPVAPKDDAEAAKEIEKL